jgi:hypothetical protein
MFDTRISAGINVSPDDARSNNWNWQLYSRSKGSEHFIYRPRFL